MKRMRTQATNSEKIFKNTSDKGLLSKIYKKYLKHNKKKKKNTTKRKQKTQYKKWTKDLNRHLCICKEHIQMTSGEIKVYSTSYVIREMKIKITMKYHFTSISMAKSKTLTSPNPTKEVEHQKLSFIARVDAKWYITLEKEMAVSEETEHTLAI